MSALFLQALAFSAAATQLPAPAASPARLASATSTATVRILTPALIGAAYGAPLPGMEPHSLSVALPDGRSASLTVYEFE